MGESFILKHPRDEFLLWAPGRFSDIDPPLLVLGRLSPGDELSFDQIFRGELEKAEEKDIWKLGCNDLHPPLEDDRVYHYWFEIVDTSPDEHGTMLVTDPLAYNVDYTLNGNMRNQPAAVIKFREGHLHPCDAHGVEDPIRGNRIEAPDLKELPNNNQLVIYELPASWARGSGGDVKRDVGKFGDIVGLLKEVDGGSTDNPQESEKTIIADLGINAIELLPAADAKPTGEWGYATAHYFATDNDLGTPTDLISLARCCQEKKIRLFMDMVMAFGHDPYIHIAYSQFHLRPQREQDNADAWQSSRDKELRAGFGGESWRYIRATDTTDPVTGISPAANERRFQYICPASAFHLLHLERWMSDFGIGGLRLDSANNIGNWDFIRRYKDDAWKRFASRYKTPQSQPEEDPDLRHKFLVIAEELAVPIDMIRSRCVNALWNEHFQRLVRATIVGESSGGDNFEWTVRKMIDCRQISFWNGKEDPRFASGTEAVNYITSHDVEGMRKERLYNYLHNIGIHDNVEKARRAKLAFVCLLTAVGIPMIFADEEFCDQHDNFTDEIVKHPSKQTDPVNYDRKTDEWRSEVFDYVKELVGLRTKCPALGDDDTDFFYWDFSNDRRIAAWKRGRADHDPVVVVANFSDQHVPTRAEAIPNWPSRLDNKQWREVIQGREIPQEWVGREDLYRWEAKVYTCWKKEEPHPA